MAGRLPSLRHMGRMTIEETLQPLSQLNQCKPYQALITLVFIELCRAAAGTTNTRCQQNTINGQFDQRDKHSTKSAPMSVNRSV